jgi:hypothetical protein
VTVSAGYSGKPVPVKLGVKPGCRLLLVAAPDGFALQPLPDEVTVHRRPGKPPYDIVLAFAPDRATLERRFMPLAEVIGTAGALWIGWPKRTSGIATDLNGNVVRNLGLAAGLVDVKVIAIDHTWSGLKFVRRLRDR